MVCIKKYTQSSPWLFGEELLWTQLHIFHLCPDEFQDDFVLFHRNIQDFVYILYNTDIIHKHS